MTISEYIFELMEMKGISRKELSEATGIAQSTISDWKRKKTNPGADKIMILCKVLEVTPEELLTGGEVTGNKGRKPDYIVVARNSTIGSIIEQYNSLNFSERRHMEGYMEALRTFSIKK